MDIGEIYEFIERDAEIEASSGRKLLGLQASLFLPIMCPDLRVACGN